MESLFRALRYLPELLGTVAAVFSQFKLSRWLPASWWLAWIRGGAVVWGCASLGAVAAVRLAAVSFGISVQRNDLRVRESVGIPARIGAPPEIALLRLCAT